MLFVFVFLGPVVVPQGSTGVGRVFPYGSEGLCMKRVSIGGHPHFREILQTHSAFFDFTHNSQARGLLLECLPCFALTSTVQGSTSALTTMDSISSKMADERFLRLSPTWKPRPRNMGARQTFCATTHRWAQMPTVSFLWRLVVRRGCACGYKKHLDQLFPWKLWTCCHKHRSAHGLSEQYSVSNMLSQRIFFSHSVDKIKSSLTCRAIR